MESRFLKSGSSVYEADNSDMNAWEFADNNEKLAAFCGWGNQIISGVREWKHGYDR